MADMSKPLGWLPWILIAAGLFMVTAGLFYGGPDLVGGVVFGVLFFAASAAILHRRAREAGAAKPNRGAAESGAKGDVGGDPGAS